MSDTISITGRRNIRSKMTDTVEVRPFQLCDLEEIAMLHEKVFKSEESYSIRLGRNFLRVTYEFFLNDAVSFGFVAVCEERVVGFVVGRLDYFTHALSLYRMRSGLLALVSHPRLLFDKQLIIRCLKVVPNYLFNTRMTQAPELSQFHTHGKTATLASLGVDPEYTQLGTSDHLLHAAEEYCRRRGMVYLRAGVFPANVPSRFIHRRRGYMEDNSLRPANNTVYYYLRL